MSFILRVCVFSTCWRFASTANVVRKRTFCLPVLLNLDKEFQFLNSKQYSTDLNLFVSDPSVRKFFDYLTDLTEHKDQDDNIAREIVQLQPVKNLLNKRTVIKNDMKNLKELDSKDNEMKKLKEQEEVLYKLQLEELDKQLIELVSKYYNATGFTSIILEITAGVGGQEAMLFVRDLYKMYIGYMNYLGLNYEVIEMDAVSQGGFRHVSVLVRDDTAFEKFMHEGGIHRVQRVPATERHGRMHTSTATVAVLPEPSNIEIKLNEKDLKIETKRASGAGGQHVNTTDSAVRITHLPSNISVTCQAGRSQLKNREYALLKLKTLLYEQQLNSQTTLSNELRKKQQGMGMRNEKIRTYNYSQDRITDHRLPNATMHHLKEFMEGGAQLEELRCRLQGDMQKKNLLDLIKKVESQLK